MHTFFEFLKKTIVLTTMVVFGFVLTYVPQIHTRSYVPVAEAAWPTFDIGINLKEVKLDAIAFAIAKQMLSVMIADTIDWINSGFQGSPAFVTDLRRTLLEAADIAMGEFLQQITGAGSFICEPFQIDIQLILALQYQQTIRQEQPFQCRLSNFVNSLEDFIQGNFTEGGLQDIFRITSNPQQYTPYGQLLEGQAQAGIRISGARSGVVTETNWGRGFLSSKICEAFEGPQGEKETCTITKPGNMIADRLNKALGAGQDSLIQADELNELISALIGQLANQALQGATGLLGLSSGTGFTSPGFAGGSFTQASVAQAGQATNQATQNATPAITEAELSAAIQVQNQVVSVVNLYTPRLEAKLRQRSLSPENRQVVTLARDQAVSMGQRATSIIPELTTLRETIIALERERALETTTPERRLAILTEQTNLVTRLMQLQPITAIELQQLQTRLDEVLKL